MDRAAGIVVLSLLLVMGADSQLVCYSCNGCESNSLGAVICGSPSTGGGSGVGPTLPTSPKPTAPSTTTVSPQVTWYPPLSSTVTPWGRSTGYVCYRIQRYLSSENRYTLDRGCALQLGSFDATCKSVTGNQGYANCEFCVGSLCNY
ncbi:uncharacterized protein LOC118512207 [Anopheles stephensi]|uniref:uncharacterized protein LOC118512207 n=1 Tax=Anopheles stephensi TaxID=30069 RepID=UPI001658B7B6|nr:uncharacterized protein LOC118512207 [Anopheles stephensi]